MVDMHTRPAMQVHPGRGLGFLSMQNPSQALLLLMGDRSRSFAARCFDQVESTEQDLSDHRPIVLALSPSREPCHGNPTC